MTYIWLNIKTFKTSFSNKTVVQALITLIITVFNGGYFTKWLEYRNYRKLELYKIKRDIVLKIFDYTTILYHHLECHEAREMLITESCKVKLYFDDTLLLSLNNFISEKNKKAYYNEIVKVLKTNFK